MSEKVRIFEFISPGNPVSMATCSQAVVTKSLTDREGCSGLKMTSLYLMASNSRSFSAIVSSVFSPFKYRRDLDMVAVADPMPQLGSCMFEADTEANGCIPEMFGTGLACLRRVRFRQSWSTAEDVEDSWGVSLVK